MEHIIIFHLGAILQQKLLYLITDKKQKQQQQNKTVLDLKMVMYLFKPEVIVHSSLK